MFDGVNVTGAWGWAIFDNYEWFSGSSVRFGLQVSPHISLPPSLSARARGLTVYDNVVSELLTVRDPVC